MTSDQNNKEDKPKRILRMSAEEASSFKENREREKEDRLQQEGQENQETWKKDKSRDDANREDSDKNRGDGRDRGGYGDKKRGGGRDRGGYGDRNRGGGRDRGGYGDRNRGGGRDRGGYGDRNRGGGRDRGGYGDRNRGGEQDRGGYGDRNRGGGQDRGGYGDRNRGGGRDRGGFGDRNHGRDRGGDRDWDQDKERKDIKDRNNVHLYLSPRVLALAEEFAEELNVPVSKYISDIIKFVVFAKADERPQHDRYRTEFVSQNKLKTTGWTPESPGDTDTQEIDIVREEGPYRQGQVEARRSKNVDEEQPQADQNISIKNDNDQIPAKSADNQDTDAPTSASEPNPVDHTESQIETRDDLDMVTSENIEAASAIQTGAQEDSGTEAVSEAKSEPQQDYKKTDLKKRTPGKGYRNRSGNGRGRESSSGRGQRKRSSGSRGPKSGSSSGAGRSKSGGKKSYGRSGAQRGRASAQSKKRRNDS